MNERELYGEDCIRFLAFLRAVKGSLTFTEDDYFEINIGELKWDGVGDYKKAQMDIIAHLAMDQK